MLNSYQVLARRFRPRSLEEVAGQEHVLRVLTHALNENRVHHAYLFTGTRGIGKTTLARILAKCLNCESGVTSHPCGKCSACSEIDEGCFIDLIEVDAASRTKVEDTRELLENVQYPPVYGRYKIYLIDEVHMLSGHSFNALLKTLEEPPAHVKFLLATTDPQKLPATILSRCLQFHLKPFTVTQIIQQLERILTQEKIPFETAALAEIAKGAKGSMRDALSILDQAISFTHQNVTIADVNALLGILSKNEVEPLLKAIASQSPKDVLEVTAKLAEKGADFGHILDELIAAFYRIAVLQCVPDMKQDVDETYLLELSQKFSKEDVQLYYQICLLGKKDLSFGGEPKSSVEMTLLRLLVFRPAAPVELSAPKVSQPPTVAKKAEEIKPVLSSPREPLPTNASPLVISDWSSLMEQLSLTGVAYTLAANCALSRTDGCRIELTIGVNHQALMTEGAKTRLQDALKTYFKQPVTVIIKAGKVMGETPAQKKARLSSEAHQAATKKMQEDDGLRAITGAFGVALTPENVEISKEEE